MIFNWIKSALAVSVACVSVAASAQVTTRIIPPNNGPQVKFVRTVDPMSFSPMVNTKGNAPGRQPTEPIEPKLSMLKGVSPSLFPVGKIGGATGTTTSLGGFPGMAQDASGLHPPDPSIAVGPKQIVQVVNVRTAFYDRKGNELFEQTLDSGGFFGTTTATFNFDPKVIYDQASGHFFMVCLSVDFTNKISNFLIAVSTSSDALKPWNVYQVADGYKDSANNEYWLDYPIISTSSDTLAITGNLFGYTSGFAGVGLFLFDKSAMINKAFTTASFVNLPNDATLELARPVKVGNQIWGVAYTGVSGSFYRITKSGAGWIKDNAIIGLQVQGSSASAATTKTGSSLDTIGDRVIDASLNNNQMVFAATIGYTNGPAVQWWQFDTTNFPPVGIQSGLLTESTTNYSMPGIGFNGNGDIGISASQTGSKNGDVAVFGHRAKDPLGSVGKPLVTRSALPTASYTGFRWGDYAMICADPLNTGVFWSTNEWLPGGANSKWGTYISQFTLGRTVALGATSVSPVLGTASGTIAGLTTAGDGNAYKVTSALVAGRGQYAVFDTSFKYPFNGNPDLSLTESANLAIDSGDTVTVNVQLWNITAARWDTIKAFQVTTTPTAFTADWTTNVGAYVDPSTFTVKVRYLAIRQYRIAGVAPPAFTLTADYAQSTLTGSD